MDLDQSRDDSNSTTDTFQSNETGSDSIGDSSFLWMKKEVDIDSDEMTKDQAINEADRNESENNEMWIGEIKLECEIKEEPADSEVLMNNTNGQVKRKSKYRPPRDRIHQCPASWCTKVFNRPDRLRKHLLVHTNDRKFVCEVADCGKSYTTSQHLKRHVQTNHTEPSDEVIECPECHNLFSNKYNLRKHFERCHLNRVPKFFCDTCCIAFGCKSELNEHLFKIHEIKTIACDKCDKVFMTNHAKNKHARSHKTYTCDDPQCFGLVFDKYVQKRRHDMLKHPSVFYCDNCDFQTPRKLFLQEHMYKHLPQWERPLYRCTFENCTKTFFLARNYTQHFRRVHSLFKVSYQCPMGCLQSFTTKQSYQRHVKTMHDVNSPIARNPADLPFPCKLETCFKRFDTEKKAHRHFLRMHREVRPVARKLSGYSSCVLGKEPPCIKRYTEERLKYLIHGGKSKVDDTVFSDSAEHFISSIDNFESNNMSTEDTKNENCLHLEKSGEPIHIDVDPSFLGIVHANNDEVELNVESMISTPIISMEHNF